MKSIRHLISFLIVFLMISESSYAGFWNKEPDMNIGNEIQKEEFPEGKDVEPKLETAERYFSYKGRCRRSK